MWESNTMNIKEALAASGVGLIVVMLVLVVLAMAIISITKIIKILGLGIETKVTPAIPNVSKRDELDEESYAVIMAAISEEMKQSPDKFRIIEIKEIN